MGVFSPGYRDRRLLVDFLALGPGHHWALTSTAKGPRS
jgi:hypothetical protein